MKNLGKYFILFIIVTSCNIPKDGEGENIPTSKLEVLTNLGDEDTVKVTKDSIAPSKTH